MKNLCLQEPDWKILNVLHSNASQVAALDLGYKAGTAEIRQKPLKVVYLLGADEGTISPNDLASGGVVIYQGILSILNRSIHAKRH